MVSDDDNVDNVDDDDVGKVLFDLCIDLHRSMREPHNLLRWEIIIKDLNVFLQSAKEKEKGGIGYLSKFVI